MKNSGIASPEQWHDFDEIIDVRTPSEFAEDHLPNALNYPVLTDQERTQVGTIYHQESSFAGKKLGAAWIAKNIAKHIETHFFDKPKSWRPLIYCWRGGKRSGAMTHILRQIGWNAHQLEGGYKAFRREIVQSLEELPKQFHYRVITGATGSAKSRILEKLALQGQQVLDLEMLANHKGSVLGSLPKTPQPKQKMFETFIWQKLQSFDSKQCVYVEAESKKIGSLQVPTVLMESMRQSPCIKIEASIDARVRFLIEDYRYFTQDPKELQTIIGYLKDLRGEETIKQWNSLIDQKDWDTLVRELLEKHYDALYRKSQHSNYIHHLHAPSFSTDDLSDTGITQLAQKIAAL